MIPPPRTAYNNKGLSNSSTSRSRVLGSMRTFSTHSALFLRFFESKRMVQNKEFAKPFWGKYRRRQNRYLPQMKLARLKIRSMSLERLAIA